MKRSTILIILLHLLYWASPIYHIFTYAGSKDPHFIVWYHDYLFGTLFGLVCFYTIYFYIFPNFIQKREAAPHAGLVLYLITMIAGVGVPVLFEILKHNFHEKYSALDLGQIMLYALAYSVAAFLIKGFVTWAIEVKYKEDLEKNNLETNLALLKARINPHFLFNTLNNIDVLIEKDPTIASSYLKKLSDILRFTLYESPSAIVLLQKEADYIKQYIELQQIRTSNADFVRFSFEPGNDNLQVAPMMFIPFIENAFKYSTNKKIKNAVVISLKVGKDRVIFTCSNAYDADTKVQYEESSGLGLQLIKSRLELLYPKNYQLDIHKTNDRFDVNLTITLHDDKLPDN